MSEWTKGVSKALKAARSAADAYQAAPDVCSALQHLEDSQEVLIDAEAIVENALKAHVARHP